MQGITDAKGLSEKVLGHIFLGELKAGHLQGYHHEGEDYGDRIADVATVDYGPITVREVSENKGKGIYEATICDKATRRIRKGTNGGKSTFFNRNWSRQQVVDCIDRAIVEPRLNYQKKNIVFDHQEGIVLVRVNKSAYPILRY